MADQKVGNAANILVGASPLYISNLDSSDTTGKYLPATPNGSDDESVAFVPGESYRDTLNKIDPTLTSGSPATKDFAFRNVGYTNNGLQITYNPTYENVTVDQLLDSAKVFKSAMEVMIATEMSEGTLENVLVVFGQAADTKTGNTLGLAAGALGSAPIERQLIAVGQAPTTSAANAERVYYARRVLSVQQSQFSLARNTPTTFPVTFRLLPDADATTGEEYGFILDRVL